MVLFTLGRGLGSGRPELDFPIYASLYVLAVVLMVRFGVIPMIVGVLVSEFLGSVPLTLDPTVWYFSHSLAALLVVAAIAFYGFRAATAGRPLFREETLAG